MTTRKMLPAKKTPAFAAVQPNFKKLETAVDSQDLAMLKEAVIINRSTRGGIIRGVEVIQHLSRFGYKLTLGPQIKTTDRAQFPVKKFFFGLDGKVSRPDAEVTFIQTHRGWKIAPDFFDRLVQFYVRRG